MYRKTNAGENEELGVKKESLKVVEKDFLCVILPHHLFFLPKM